MPRRARISQGEVNICVNVSNQFLARQLLCFERHSGRWGHASTGPVTGLVARDNALPAQPVPEYVVDQRINNKPTIAVAIAKEAGRGPVTSQAVFGLCSPRRLCVPGHQPLTGGIASWCVANCRLHSGSAAAYLIGRALDRQTLGATAFAKAAYRATTWTPSWIYPNVYFAVLCCRSKSHQPEEL